MDSHTKYYEDIYCLMECFSRCFVERKLHIPLKGAWSKSDKEHISEGVGEVLDELTAPRRRFSNGKLLIGGIEITHPSYKGEEARDLLGFKVVSRIEEFVRGNSVGFSNRTLDLVSLVCGYPGFYGWLRDERLSDDLLEATTTGMWWTNCCVRMPRAGTS
jgi:hypothetical protein